MAKFPHHGKKKKHQAHLNHERWVISYADLLTLLLATFVVLYASSTRNKYKQEEIAKAFIEAFHGAPPAILVPTPSGSHGVLQHHSSPIPKPPAPAKIPAKMEKQLHQEMKNLQALSLKLKSMFQPMIDKHQVTINNAPLTLSIQLDASVLFASGEATLKPDAAKLLTQVGKGLTQLPPGFHVVVRGYTDNQPISTPEFPSNWSLSAERAVAVVQLFMQTGVPGENLAAEGFGEYAPIADNSTDTGRAQNRRVVVVVQAPPSNKEQNNSKD
ncbi:OmpA family protein [Acidocella aminolytica]|jgi:chemotaxis protein MotB|uniref:Outer membrane protein OmpA/MotB n=1 Tax=Acidocella aminolytica 101 = DSM 11237 TaxID=1120923 RepID=A0A0D6PFC3_9PROT|nr:OmpA family protein [Acidocella aminolytica]GAN80056.1 outer membrane protein OmpA/MotB [Acidocella aminolytica 101 = DSM 11237]GBQ40649.1 flagellar motor protein [Acidocella aminolytica 101 = DSM 11237]SHF07734.1 chemotaxis protein MotB [Acidocella aminolytica 101 = DSM 11237]